MSVSSAICSPKIKAIKQKSMMTSSCLFAMFTATSRCSRLGQTESNYPVSVGEAKLTFSCHDSKSHYVQSRHFSASWTVVGAKLILAARWRIDMKMTLVIQLGAGQEWLLLDAWCIQCNCDTHRRSCSRWISLRESSRSWSFSCKPVHLLLQTMKPSQLCNNLGDFMNICEKLLLFLSIWQETIHFQQQLFCSLILKSRVSGTFLMGKKPVCLSANQRLLCSCTDFSTWSFLPWKAWYNWDIFEREKYISFCPSPSNQTCLLHPRLDWTNTECSSSCEGHVASQGEI